MPDRTYTQQEIARILDGAAKRQAASPTPEGGGLTLEELEEVAAASGIAPEHVAAAAAALAGSPAARGRVLGMPVEVEGSRLLPGPVSDETWSKMVAELRRAFGGPGVVSGDGRMRTWSTVTGRRSSPVVATVEPEGGRTRISLGQSTRDRVTRMLIPNTFFVAFALVFLVIGLVTGDPELFTSLLFFGTFAALLQAGLQVGTRSWARNRTRDFDAVADRLELIARSSTGGADVPTADRTEAGPVGERAATAPPAGRIALDDAEGADLTQEAGHVAPRTRT